LFQQFENDPSLGYEVVGLVGASDRNFVLRDRVLGSYDDLDDVLVGKSAIGVVVSPGCVRERDLNTMTRRLTDDGYHVVISASLQDIDVSRLRPQSIDGRSVLYVEPVARSGAPVVAKRVFDVGVASTLLVVLSPLMLLAAIAIKTTSTGPALFRQTRVGRNGTTFTMSKLRTMVVDAEDRLDDLAGMNEADGPLFKIDRDPRVTRVGHFLRRSSIDELPQLLAVVRGTMSMVGPRPALPSEVVNWDSSTRERLRVLPGLTGLWQISGRSDASFDTYKRLDLYYVDNWSLRHDTSICARTVGVVLRARGAR
jgi:exopolysaccharide biosynthesis polyprenyl glycosylphosphotransferase